jgi:hypothetical protein
MGGDGGSVAMHPSGARCSVDCSARAFRGRCGIIPGWPEDSSIFSGGRDRVGSRRRRASIRVHDLFMGPSEKAR